MDSYKELAATEIGFIGSQAGWLYAFASGVSIHPGWDVAHGVLVRQAEVWARESAAAQMRLDALTAAATPAPSP